MSLITLKHPSSNHALSKLQDLFCDSEIRTQTKVFKVHRLVLAGESDFFMKMFASSCREENGIVQMPHINDDLFDQIIQYIYNGECTIDHRNLRPLLECAHMCYFVELARNIEAILVQEFIRNHREKMSILGIIQEIEYAGKYGLVDLEAAAIKGVIEMISTLRNAVYHDPECISRLSFNQIKQIVSAPAQLDCSESALFDIAKAWIGHNDVSEAAQATLLSEIRFVFIPREKRQKIAADPLMKRHFEVFADSFVRTHDHIRDYVRRGKEIELHNLQINDAVTVINDAIEVRKLCQQMDTCHWVDNMIDLLGNTYKIAYLDTNKKVVRLEALVKGDSIPFSWNFPALALVSEKVSD